MSDATTRQELKRNELGEALGAGLEFVEEHLRTLLWILGAALLAALATWMAFVWWSDRKADANVLLGRAIRIAEAPILAQGARPNDSRNPSFLSEAERNQRARELFEEIAKRYSRTPAGQAARVQLGVLAFREGNLALARQEFEAYLRRDNRSVLAVAVQESLNEIDRIEGRGEALAERLRQQVEKPDLRLPQDFVLIELARTLERIGRAEEARTMYRRLIDEYPSSPYLQEAQQRLNDSGPDR